MNALRLSVFLVCGAAGYFTVAAMSRPVALEKEQTAAALKGPAPAAEPFKVNISESAMAREWEELRTQHGGDTADMAALYGSVKDVKEAFRRRAFRSALLAEWAGRDPKAALEYLLAKDQGNAGHLLREWMRRDAQGAINTLLAGDEKMRGRLRGMLDEIARRAPERLAEVLSKLPKSESRWDTTGKDAFATFAAKDLEAARAAAELIQGPNRTDAVGGVAKAWGEKDGPAALEWAQAMPAGEVRDNALREVLTGWAKKDPMAALDKLDLAPPGGSEMYHGSDVAARVLGEAAKKDWDGTLRWLEEHPGKVGRTGFDLMQDVLSKRMSKDLEGTLRTVTQGKVPELAMVFGNSVLNDGYAHREAIWQWLDRQPSSAQTQSLRSSILNAVAWKDPKEGLEYLEKIPDTAENASLFENGARQMAYADQRMAQFEDLLKEASPKLRKHLLAQGFMAARGEVAENPQLWVKRLDEVAPDKRAHAISGLSTNWAGSDPEAAARWALSLKDESESNTAVGGVAGSWVGSDPAAATKWASALPPGKMRDTAAVQIVHGLARTQPEAAWEWATSMQSPEIRVGALTAAYSALRKKNPDAATQMLQSSGLAANEIQVLEKMPASNGGLLQTPLAR
jgi:hypothetical protein